MARFAGGSMVHFSLFWKNCARRAQFFQKRMVGSALPEANLIRWMEDRVTRVKNRIYAVGSKPDGCLNKWPDSPPAGWKKTKKYHAAASGIRCHREQTAHLNAHRVRPVKKIKQDHAAAGEIRRYRVQMPGLLAHRVTRACEAYGKKE
jgi:hypothetical protein